MRIFIPILCLLTGILFLGPALSGQAPAGPAREISLQPPPAGADASDLINAAFRQAGIGGTVRLGPGNYYLSKTLQAYANQSFRGSGNQSTILHRSGDYGDTLVFGSSTESCGSVAVSDMWFLHGGGYDPQTMDSLPHRASQGAHIRLWHCQPSRLDNVWLWRLPYQVVYEGGSLARMEDCNLQGYWDHRDAALQEGIAEVWIRHTPPGLPTDFRFTNNSFTGQSSRKRSVDYTSSDQTVAVDTAEAVGSQYLIKVDCIEGMELSGNYISGANQNNLLFCPVANDPVLDVRIHNNFFDSGRQYQIQLSPGADQNISGIVIEGNIFNGEGNSLGALFAASVQDSPNPVGTYNLIFSHNAIFAHLATPVLLFGVDGAVVKDNTITFYNCQAVGKTDQSWINAISVAQASRHIEISAYIAGSQGEAGRYADHPTVYIEPALQDVNRFDSSTLPTGAWQAYTPVLAATAGELGGYTASGRYQVLGKTVSCTVSFTLTDNGSGQDRLLVSLPVPAAGGFAGSGADTGRGILLGCYQKDANQAIVALYDGSYPGLSGTACTISFSYEAK